jgi:deoxyribodipyrimidine photolyase-related protein
MSNVGHITLGNQLFDTEYLPIKKSTPIFMSEDRFLCTYFKFHKIKIAFFLSSMRQYADHLQKNGFDISYVKLGTSSISQKSESSKSDFILNLKSWIVEKNITSVTMFEVEDLFFKNILCNELSAVGIEVIFLKSPMFLTTHSEFSDYLGTTKRPFMKTFYEKQRIKYKILTEKDSTPVGGKWSFDEDNRKKLPTDLNPAPIQSFKQGTITKEIFKLVEDHFADHPGSLESFWLPTNHRDAKSLLDDFISSRFQLFGPYEDALTERSDFVYHSGISALLNIGLLTPTQVIDTAIKYFANSNNKISLASCEGFIRQVIGWREFVRGIYHRFEERLSQGNFWSHQGKLNQNWYTGTTGIKPLDHAISKSWRLAYCHHIERLMILGNFMLLSRIHPMEVYRWFMEMFVDSSDWVMLPNVCGMSQFSDGGIFATKPYICGSNYILKMSHYEKEPWTSVADALYWAFIIDNENTFQKNPRSSMMAVQVRKMTPEKKKQYQKTAYDFIAQNSI